MKTIEAKDLRQGNYVNRGFFNPHPVTPRKEYSSCEVVSIGIEKIITSEKIGSNALVKCDYDNIKPITLTEDWLVKLGFEIRLFNEDESKPIYWIEEKNRFIDIYPHKEHNFYFLINTLQMSTPLKYVHQLQNLFHSLTGQELTIKQ